eukprot:893620-Pyramimonas_sp.AAC.1
MMIAKSDNELNIRTTIAHMMIVSGERAAGGGHGGDGARGRRVGGRGPVSTFGHHRPARLQIAGPGTKGERSSYPFPSSRVRRPPARRT